MEYCKSENGLLRRKVKKLLRKVKKLLRKVKRQSCLIHEQDLKLDAREAELLGIHGALETKTRDEKKGLLAKLGLAEKSASSVSKIEKGIQIEDYTLQASKRS
ncbi:hypothetical protein EV1_014485 [Malus domestica]